LFSFLSRATTGLASRAYASNASDGAGTSSVEAARDAASPALTVSLICGAALTLIYSFRTPALLQLLNVDPMLRRSATSYIHWRGATAWAAMAQNVCLSLFMVTRDVITPLKIISCAAVANVIGDALFCVWIRGGTGGAAAATTCATLISSVWMVAALRKKELLPALRIPNKKELAALAEYTGPLLAITLTRMAGFLNMQRKAMTLGVTALAGYQLVMNLLIFFILFGEPLSQLGQTKLPGLIEDANAKEAKKTLKSILLLSVFAAAGVGAAAFLTSISMPGLFSTDLGVQAVAKGAAPMLFLAVSMTIMGIAIDGAMMASRDFGFMLGTGIISFFVQSKLLEYCSSVQAILATCKFTCC
jgi:Na+-driven multidrug efflux pump